MDSHNILSLLGLALRGSHLAVGEEPVEAVARARDARVLLLASDAADNTRRRTEHFAQAGQCLWLRLPFSKAELGRAVGRTSAAIVAVTDIGLANAVVHKLAQLDESQYGEAAQRLELKAKRAAERQAEQRAHEKNVRTGKYRPSPKSGTARKEEAPPPRRESSRQERDPERQQRPRRNGQKPAFGRKAHGSGHKPVGKSAPRPNPYAHSRPVKKGKGSFRKRES